MTSCDICINDESKGRIYMLRSPINSGFVEIREEDKYKLHQSRSHEAEDILNEYIDRNINEIENQSIWSGNYCSKCYDTEFKTGDAMCCRCRINSDELSEKCYIIYKSDLDVNIETVESKSLSGLQDVANKKVVNASFQPICVNCLESLGFEVSSPSIF